LYIVDGEKCFSDLLRVMKNTSRFFSRRDKDSLAFAGNADPGGRPGAGPRKDLVAGIRAVQGEPGGEAGVERASGNFLSKTCLNRFLKYVNAHRYVR